ncbi:GNAT family N-acetyltransferase [Micromonospora musae]|uniref:GNAT family N-acetyltransferase n=1 Tax=Micromonospora musae TaxID=1894970 RepID=UPI0033FDD6B7
MTNEELTTAMAEAAEADFMYAYEAGTPAAAQERLGIAVDRIGGGVVLSMRNDPVSYWSKALGFGFTEPVTRDLVDRIVAFYRAQGTAGAVIQVAPSVLPAEWDEIRLAHGLEPASSWVKLAAPIEQVRPGAGTRLRVAPVGGSDAVEWAQVVLRGFGMPIEGLAEMLAASVDHPQFRPYGVWDGADLVGGANLFVRGPVGALNAGSTLPSHRNLGVQSALIAARAEAARAAGCRWLIAETGQPAEGTKNQSLANLERAGLRVRYARQNWRWQADADPSPAG